MTRKGERRGHARRSGSAKATAGGQVLAYVRNFSETGARISVVGPSPLEPGHVFWLKSIGPVREDIRIEARCRVVWSECLGPYCDVGVEFIEMDEAVRKRIRRVSERAEEPAGALPPEVKVELLEEQPEA